MQIKALKKIQPCEGCDELYFKEKFINKRYHFIEGYLLEIIDKQAEIRGCIDCLNVFIGENYQYLEAEYDNSQKHSFIFNPQITHPPKSTFTRVSDCLKSVIPHLLTIKKEKGQNNGPKPTENNWPSGQRPGGEENERRKDSGELQCGNHELLEGSQNR